MEQDAHQLMTASNEGLAPEEPKLEEGGQGPAADWKSSNTSLSNEGTELSASLMRA